MINNSNSSEDEFIEEFSSDIDFEIIPYYCKKKVIKHDGLIIHKNNDGLAQQKKILCYSLLYGKECNYGKICSYAHSLEEQVIDVEKKYILDLIIDKTNDLSVENISSKYPIDYVYKRLETLSFICNKCKNNKCTGGYNCKHGANCDEFKICKKDLLTGNCDNTIKLIEINNNRFDIKGCQYEVCDNGHHLTKRGLMPYYKLIYKQEMTNKDVWHAERHISQVVKINYTSYPSDETTDDELNNWFKKSSDSLDEI